MRGDSGTGVAEWIGQFLGQLPAWAALPAAFVIVIVGWILWIVFVDPYGDIPLKRWLDRRRREKEINRGKK
jgi:cytochrome b subunit of formate dehydrogenase